MLRSILTGFFALFSLVLAAQTFTGTPTISTAGPYCAGSTITVNWAISSNFTAGNIFTVQLSTSAGAFPGVNLGTVTSTSATSLAVAIPLAQAASATYLIRVTSSNPALTSANTGAFTIRALGISTPTFTGSPFCAGATFNITNTLINACNFGAGNTFTVQLSNSAGSFATPTNIGSASSTSGGSISVTIPSATAPTGSGYLMRIVSTSPALTSASSAALTINTLIEAPTITGSPFCAGTTFNITNNLGSSCSLGAGNVFTVQLSSAAGSFAAPTNIGSTSSTSGGIISVTIPLATAGGAGYLMRVVSSNPAITGPSSPVITVSAVGISAPTVTGSPFCAGSTFNITNNLTNACDFGVGNTFTVQLSNAAGSFAAPTTIGSTSSVTGGTISVTIPPATAGGAGYLIRVVSSSPVVTGANSAAVTVSALGISAPTITGSPFCAGSTFNITNNLTNACDFGVGNTFTVQLSNAAGSFAAPTTIGSTSSVTGGTISVTIPPATAGGAGYLIRVVSSSPVVTGANSAAVTVSALGISAPTITGSPFCAGSTFNITNNLSNACDFSVGNTFTVQLSSAAGSFAAPTTIGSASSVTGGTISVTIPFATAGGAGYLIRVVSSSPVVTGSNSAAQTISAVSLNAPTVTGSPFCQGSVFNITNNLANACTFGTGNTFTVQLSDNTGVFGSPTTIGSASSISGGTISVTIPPASPTGAAYRIRVVSSNPVVTSANSGALTINAPALNAPTVTGSPFCLGGIYNVTNNLGNTCAFSGGNTFTVQLSDNTGSFASPTTIGSSTTTTGGAISITIPLASTPAAGYRMRVVSSNPIVTSADNGANLTVSAYGINAPTFAGTTFCPNQALTVNYTVLNSCGLPNTPSANTFTAQLSNSFGSFASPTNIGIVTSNTSGSISTTIPVGTTPGNGYRIRVTSSNPGAGLISADNGTNLTVNAINLNAPTFAATTFCPGATFTLSYTFVSGCNFIAGNTFTAQISDATGSFAAPTTIGTNTATTPGNFSVTIPATTPAGTGYRIRVLGSNPVATSLDNGTNLTVNAFGINAPTFAATSFCQAQTFNIAYTIQNGCAFPNTPSNNVFTAQLSNAAGSFASATTIGTLSATGAGTIIGTIPGGTPAGTAYRIRVVSSNPGSGIIGADNGTDLTVNASAGNPTVFGTTAWNAYAYSGTAIPITNNSYLGTYTENNLSFDTRNRWVNTAGPGTADATTGAAYSGCPTPITNFSVSFKRTNFTCGYYQIDIPAHDDDVRLIINGSPIFNSAGVGSHSNVWTGFLGPTSAIEFQFLNGGGPGYLQVAFSISPNSLTVSPNIVQCSAPITPATLTVSASVPLTYAWTPTTGLTPASGVGASVQAAPPSTTVYTVTGTDATSGCTVTGTTTVTVSNATPIITLTTVPTTICSSIVTSTLTASGASTYLWSPATGLSGTTGNSVVANPPSTTTYTVVGNNGCASPGGDGSNSSTVTVQTIPGAPTPTTFGNGVWNAFCHNNTTLSNYYGYYTENNLSFNTTTRWAGASGPTVANATTGSAYQGCTFGTTNYSVSFRRTNFTCGYYQIDIPYQDDNLTILINGVQVFQRNAFTNTLQSNVWTGFLGPSSTVELQLANGTGPGNLQITFAASVSRPQSLNTDITVCAGTDAVLSATSAIAGATYAWSVGSGEPTITFTPSATGASPTIQTTGATPAGNYTIINTLTDAAGTGCSVSKSFTLTVDPLPNTTVLPTSGTIICPTSGITLTASGAASYSWSPSAGLSATTGFSVVATPTTTTTYTVVGSNNCATNSAASTITVIPLPAITTFPTGTWNVYGFDSNTIGTNYEGYYTENGSGATGLSFDTRTRWASAGAPSTANATNGIAWQGCTMGATTISLSFKRTGFSCGVYQLDVPAHDDDFLLFINGIQVAQHAGCCDAHTNVWTGSLNANSTVEWQMKQGTGGSYLQVTFTLVAQPAGTTVWIGGTNNDWFTASNWCNGIPTSTTDALIPAAGPQNMPVINNTGAVVRNITINPAVASSAFANAIAAANLTTNTFNLDVYGNWINNGILTPNAGSVSFVGTASGNTISSTGTETFGNIIINKTNGITLSSGIHQVSGNMTFTTGIVTQNSTLRILNGGTVSVASNTSYVDGIVTKVGTNAFTFPIGKNGLYRPISISAPAIATDTYTARYFDVTPNPTYPQAQRSVTLDHVSAGEYWLLNRTAGTSNVRITLSWGSNSGGVGSLSTLRVAGWNGSLWTDQGNGGTSGTVASGTVINAAPSTTYGPFTLGTADNNNTLPVRLMNFDCGLNQNGIVELKWSTATEMNSDYFDLQYSTDAESFKSAARIKAAGNSNTKRSYSYKDINAPAGKVYYRLKPVDFDGSVDYSNLCLVENSGSNGNFKLYPNPASGFTTMDMNGAVLNSLRITNNIGQQVNSSHTIEDGKISINTTTLVPGIYVVEVVLNQKLIVLKLVVQ